MPSVMKHFFHGSFGFSSEICFFFFSCQFFHKPWKCCDISEPCVCTNGASNLIPVKQSKKKKHCWYFRRGHSHILASHLPSWSCKLESEREDANTSYLTGSRQNQPSRPFPPRGGTGLSSRLCGRQFQPQCYVISVHHSQQCSSHSSSAHKDTSSLANHFSSREALANKKQKKMKAVKSLSETPLRKIFLGFPAALKSCLSPFM